jgi:hypothetical protein
MGFEKLKCGAGCLSGGRWILTCDEVSIHLDEWSPIRPLRVQAAEPFQFVLYKERDDFGELGSLFLGVRESGHVPAHYQWSAVATFYVLQGTWCMTDKGDGPAGGNRVLNQRDRVSVVCKIP